MSNDKSGYTKKKTDWLLREKEEHFDKDGNKIGETRFKKDWLLRNVQEHLDANGEKIGETRKGTDWRLRDRAEHFDADGEKIGHSYDDTDWRLRPIERHHDQAGHRVGTSRRTEDWLGRPRKEHSGTFFKSRANKKPERFLGSSYSGSNKAPVAVVLAVLGGVIALIGFAALRTPNRHVDNPYTPYPPFQPVTARIQVEQLRVYAGAENDAIRNGEQSFRIEEIQSSNLVAAASYRGATPFQNVFRFEWYLDGKLVITSANEAVTLNTGILQNVYGGPVRPGTYQVKLFIDQNELATTSFVIQPEDNPVEPANPVMVESPLSLRTGSPSSDSEGRDPLPEPVSPIVLPAQHKHLMGSCSGQLQLEDRLMFLPFNSNHVLKIARDRIRSVHEDGIVDSHNKKWHFKIEGKTPSEVHEIIERWYEEGQR